VSDGRKLTYYCLSSSRDTCCSCVRSPVNEPQWRLAFIIMHVGLTLGTCDVDWNPRDSALTWNAGFEHL
jgi:hypothetical protein